MNEAQLLSGMRAPARRAPGMRMSGERAGRVARRLVAASALASLLALGACASTPDWANPVEWYKGASSVVFQGDKEPEPEPKTEEAAELKNRPVPGAGEPFPNLASVPQRPTSVTSSAERKRITESLVADRDNARYVDPPPPRPTVALPPPTRPQSAADSASAAPAAPAQPAASAAPEPPPPPPPAAVPPAPPSAPPSAIPSAPPAAAGGRPSAQASPPRATSPAPQAPNVSAAPRPRVADSQPTPPPPAVAAPPEVVAATPAPLPPPRLNGPQPDAVVLFNDGSSQISADQRRGLAALVRDAKGRDATVRVVGRSSMPKNQSQAALLANFNQAWNRAHAVADALTRLGVPASRIRVEAETSPEAAPEVASVPKGDAGLRRADIYLE
jgi:outer membrane protein OmpA-like peptidoglycan-associated protein